MGISLFFKILPLLMSLLTTFAAKKAGMKTGPALALGAAAGLGTYYVGQKAGWYDQDVGGLSNETANSDPEPVPGELLGYDKNGDPIYEEKYISRPPGGEDIYDEKGKRKVDGDGNPMTTKGPGFWASSKDLLTSWGADGTAKVIGTTAAAPGLAKTSSSLGSKIKEINPYVLLGAAFGTLYLLKK